MRVKFLFFRPVWVTLVLLSLFAGERLWEYGQYRAKLTSDEWPQVERSGAEVILRFAPETFHMTALQNAGRVIRVDGNVAHVVDVKLAELRSLSGKYWVHDIVPAR